MTSLATITTGWRRGVERRFPDLVADLPTWLAETDRQRALRAVSGDLLKAVLVAPDRVRRELAGAPKLVENAVTEEAATTPRGESLGLDVVDMYDIGNALECAGVAIAKSTWATLVGWFPRVSVKRDHEMAFYYWSIGFAALALDDKPTYRRFAGLDENAPLPFEPGATFGFNLQGLLRHLAGAVEQRASLPDVRPAWDELLENFGTLWEARSVKEGTLLWMARIVYHRIGGVPLADVAARLRDDLQRHVAS